MNTSVIPFGSETLWLSSDESFALACTSGTTKYNAIATSSPKVPTERKGSEKPPMLYNVDPNAGPKVYQTWALDIESCDGLQLRKEKALLGLYRALAFLPIM